MEKRVKPNWFSRKLILDSIATSSLFEGSNFLTFQLCYTGPYAKGWQGVPRLKALGTQQRPEHTSCCPHDRIIYQRFTWQVNLSLVSW